MNKYLIIASYFIFSSEEFINVIPTLDIESFQFKICQEHF